MGIGPEFLGIGQQKAGTGWLYDQLSRHPSVWMPPIKEVKFVTGEPFRDNHRKWLRDYEIYEEGVLRHPFTYLRAKRRIPRNRSGERNITRKTSNLDFNFWRNYAEAARTKSHDPDWYLSALATPDGIKSGDISPNYSTASIGQIRFAKSIVPDAKILFLVRNPVSRAKSAISMAIRRNRIEETVLQDWSRMQDFLDSPHFSLRSGAVDTWKRWTSVFGEEQCRYWLLDEIISEPDVTRDAIFAFLDLEAVDLSIRADHNRKAKAKKSDFSPDMQKRLEEYFADELAQAGVVFGRAAANW